MQETQPEILWRKCVDDTIAAVQVYGDKRAAYVAAKAAEPFTPHLLELLEADKALDRVRGLLARPYVPAPVVSA